MINNDYFNEQFHFPLLSMIARVHVMSDWKLQVQVNNMYSRLTLNTEMFMLQSSHVNHICSFSLGLKLENV